MTNVVSFLMGFSQAFVIYIMSSYFKLSAGTENVGPFYFVAYLISLVALLNFHKIVKYFGKSNAFYFSLVFKLVSIAFLINAAPSVWGIFFMILYIIFGTLEWVSLDIIIESFSSDRLSGRIRGKHLAIINTGFLLAPFLSTYILQNLDYGYVFLMLFLFNSVILVTSIFSFRNVNHRFDGEITVSEIIKKVYARKNILRIFYISFTLELFYALTVIYIPIYLLNLGMGWDKIGIVITIMLLPFVFIQYPIGILADKKFGEKEFIILALFIMGFSTAAIYFITATSVWVWALVLLVTRTGAAIVEVLRDSYFYKRIDGHDVDVINFFRTAMPLGYVISTVCSTALLLIFSIKTVFIFVALVVFSALLAAFFLADNKSERELLAENGKK